MNKKITTIFKMCTKGYKKCTQSVQKVWKIAKKKKEKKDIYVDSKQIQQYAKNMQEDYKMFTINSHKFGNKTDQKSN